MKTVLIIGAHGKIGKILTEKLKKFSGFKPVALFRKEEQKTYFEELGVEYRVVSLEDTVEKLTEAIKGIDAVVFTAGSGGNTGYDKTLAVDLDGAVKAMEAAETAGVSRFVMVSAMNAGKREVWNTSKIKPYYIAKHYADRFLAASELKFTILRPGRLFDKPGTGRITMTDPQAREGVPREDVAETILETLRHDNTIGQIIEFNEGKTPIEEAVRKE